MTHVAQQTASDKSAVRPGPSQLNRSLWPMCCVDRLNPQPRAVIQFDTFFRKADTEEVTRSHLKHSRPTRHERCSSRRINSLLIANAHLIVPQQYLLIIDLAHERNRNVACVQDALGSPIVIQNRSTWQSPRVHDGPASTRQHDK